MKLKVINLGDERLERKSVEVKLPLSLEDKKLAEDLLEYLDYASEPDNDLRSGVGIAAVQVGVLKRIFAVRIPFDKTETFKEILVNPVVTYRKGKAALNDGEGCLSVPIDQDGLVHRYNEIKISGYSVLKNEVVEYDLQGYVAIVFQHEYDHLEGVLYTSRINALTPNKQLIDEKLI